MMELGIKLAAGGAAAAICAVTLRKGAPELAAVLAVAAGVWLLFSVSGALESVIALLRRLAAAAELDAAVLRPVARVVGLSVLTHVTGELCRSAGEGGVAAFLQTAGTVLALAAAAPLVVQVLELIEELAV